MEEPYTCKELQKGLMRLQTIKAECIRTMHQHGFASEEHGKMMRNFWREKEKTEEMVQERGKWILWILQKTFIKDKEDTKVQKILSQYPTEREGVAHIFNCREEQVSYTRDEALSENTVVHVGGLDLWDWETIPDDFTFPAISGYLSLSRVKAIPAGFSFPDIGNHLNLRDLTSLPDGVSFSDIGGSFYLNAIKTLPEGLSFPDIGGDFHLNNLTSLPEGFSFPDIDGSFHLGGIKTLPDGVSFSNIGGHLNLRNLTALPDDISFSNIGGFLDLEKLTTIPAGFSFPDIVGTLDLRGLTSADNLAEALADTEIKSIIYLPEKLRKRCAGMPAHLRRKIQYV